jgi:predicted nucleotidyltransferase component of viral defense system
MPTVSQLIKSVAHQKQVQQFIVEKDYALSYLLAAISRTEGLSGNLVLKGGTALKKLYFKDYRFSEDLDYSTRQMGPLEHIEDQIAVVAHLMNQSLNLLGPFQVTWEPLILPNPHPRDQKAFIIRVQFPEQRQSLCRLKVEITVDEPILTPVEFRPLLHDFPEKLSASIPVYSLLEISVEKMRALLQSKARLLERGWGASRVCRDYYDLWNLLSVPGIISPDLIPLLNEKCAVRGVSFRSFDDFLSESLLTVANNEWPQQILPFVPRGEPADVVLPQVSAMIASIWNI